MQSYNREINRLMVEQGDDSRNRHGSKITTLGNFWVVIVLGNFPNREMNHLNNAATERCPRLAAPFDTRFLEFLLGDTMSAAFLFVCSTTSDTCTGSPPLPTGMSVTHHCWHPLTSSPASESHPPRYILCVCRDTPHRFRLPITSIPSRSRRTTLATSPVSIYLFGHRSTVHDHQIYIMSIARSKREEWASKATDALESFGWRNGLTDLQK